MFDPILRPLKDRILKPCAEVLQRWVHPIGITLLAFIIAMVCATGYAFDVLSKWSALALWLGSRVLDGLDGVLARVGNKQSDLGGYLDIVLDVAVYTSIPMSIALRMGGDTVFAVAVLLGVFYFNAATWLYLSAILEKHGRSAEWSGEQTSITMPVGLVEGGETVLFYCLFILFDRYATPLFLIMAALTAIGAVLRIFWAITHLSKWTGTRHDDRE